MGLYSDFQHALRLLAFGQLYKVLNMDPLPASKPSPRLLEGVWSVMCVTCDSACLPAQRSCVCPLRQPVMFQVILVCLHPAGGCQKRFREDVGSDDRDFIKRMKGDFDTLVSRSHSWIREPKSSLILLNLSRMKLFSWLKYSSFLPQCCWLSHGSTRRGDRVIWIFKQSGRDCANTSAATFVHCWPVKSSFKKQNGFIFPPEASSNYCDRLIIKGK